MAQLTRQQEYVARWLGRAGQCSLRQAQQRGVSVETLDALVVAGRIERRVLEAGGDPIYVTVNNGVKMPIQTPEPGPARKPVPPTAVLVEQRIVDLLKDGEARTSRDVATELLTGGANFINERELMREIMRVLPGLVSQGHLTRLVFGVPVGQGQPGRFSYTEKYVAASAVVPVCLGCFRNFWAVEAVPPQIAGGNMVALCRLCGKRTNGGAYVPIKEVETRRGA